MRCFVVSLSLLTLLTGPASAAGEARPGADPAPALRTLLVQLAVADLDRAILFYTESLGCTVTERRDDLQFAHVDCGIPNLQLGLSAGGSAPVPSSSVILNFSVTGDVEDARRQLEARGVMFTGPTLLIPGKVRLAPFRDPDGHVLRLAGRVSTD